MPDPLHQNSFESLSVGPGREAGWTHITDGNKPKATPIGLPPRQWVTERIGRITKLVKTKAWIAFSQNKEKNLTPFGHMTHDRFRSTNIHETAVSIDIEP